MSSESVARNNSQCTDQEAVAATKAADLLALATDGRGDEVVRILESDLELVHVGDLNGDTILHLLANGGYVESLQQLLKFMLDENPEMLKELAKQGNADGDTPLHLAVKNGHREMVNLLEKVEHESFYIRKDDRKTSFWELCAIFSDIDIEREFNEIIRPIICQGKIQEVFEIERNLKGETIFHKLAHSGDLDMLTKLVGHLVATTNRRMTGHDKSSQLPSISLLLEGDKYGSTPLHKAINRGNMKASRYLIEVAPEAAYRVNSYGESPLYVAMKRGYDDLVKYVLEVLPEASMSEATRRSLLKPNKASILHAAIKLRKLNMLKMILESIPSLIDSLDEKGWKPLSYGAYKGYLDEVHYLLTKFPKSIKKYDSDGSLPIHKAVSGGHVCIIKAFVSIHSESLYSVDMKGRNILHIAVKCRKHDIIRYLRDEVKGVETLCDLRDNDGKTFADYVFRNNSCVSS